MVIAGQKRGLTPTMRRELRRRSAIEATIGHMKTEGRLDRNWLPGDAGDAINTLLVAAGHNLHLALNALALLLAWILASLLSAAAKTDTWPPATRSCRIKRLDVFQGGLLNGNNES